MSKTEIKISSEKKDFGLFHWKPDSSVGTNFGDELFPLIVEKILGRKIREAKPDENPKLLAGGSILQFAKTGDVVWGVGLRDPNMRHDFSNLDVRAVRGPITRDFLIKEKNISCPEIYGDPALLLPVLFPEWKALPQKGKIGVVPHYRDIPLIPPLPANCKIILPTLPKEKVIEEILSCEFIISSSLHGIIVAEAFGIPARWIKFSLIEPEIKFHDYFLSTGRNAHFVQSIEEAFSVGPEMPIIHFDRETLLKSFPHLKF